VGSPEDVDQLDESTLTEIRRRAAQVPAAVTQRILLEVAVCISDLSPCAKVAATKRVGCQKGW
jgi:hypothetical protein